ncbi:MAG TPA: lyase family protein, partial [Candidatus Nanoarchaeia archaeon]|nr:lyase family protein [Candidatus Nanoarchaeia archaeon]
EDITKYEGAINNVDLELIKQIEDVRGHDVKARIEAFVKAAGAEEHIHKGMTSRDVTDNVEQARFKKASEIIFGKYVSVLRHFVEKAEEYSLELTGRSHHQAAQLTLLGRRFSMWAEELHSNLPNFENFIEKYPLRGIKGPVGTRFDMLTLLESRDNVDRLEKIVAKHLGFSEILDSPGQVYPRSLDYALLSQLSLLSSACENFAKGMRLMAGHELVTEGFKEGRVGSTAMPHKMNTSRSERICSAAELLKMYAGGGSRLSGDQWEEGDVSCSLVRRVVIPDAFYASDAVCETSLTVLNEMGAYPLMISKEVDRYLPFLATTEILMTAVQKGIGREKAHSIIKEHAISEALRMRQKGVPPYLAKRLSEDADFKEAGITEETINSILADKAHFIGDAELQINRVVKKTQNLLDRYEQESLYEPEKIR